MPDINTSETYGFKITAFPSVKPKQRSLKQHFNRGALTFYEDEYKLGLYHLEYYLEKMPAPIEAKFIVLPNLYEKQTKKPEIKIEYSDLRYKYSARKEVVGFANEITSRMRWKHTITWITENGEIRNLKNYC